MGPWNVKQTEEFQEWFDDADDILQDDIVEHVEILKQFGPHLGRPYVDTLKGSKFKNLKELRFNSGDRVIRVFFIFDPERNAVLLIGGNKAGSGNKNFYSAMIALSEKIYRKQIERKKK